MYPHTVLCAISKLESKQSLSTDPESRGGFGPYLPLTGSTCPSGCCTIPYDDAAALERALGVSADQAGGVAENEEDQRALRELAEAVEGLNHQDKQIAGREILRALNRHSKEYRDALAEGCPITYLRPVVEMILRYPRLAVLGFWDGIVGLLVTQLSNFTSELKFSPQPWRNTDSQPIHQRLPTCPSMI